MLGFERDGWLVWGNFAVFAIACVITLALGADPSTMMVG